MVLIVAVTNLSGNWMKRERNLILAMKCMYMASIYNCKLNIGHVSGTIFTYKAENLQHPTWCVPGRDIYYTM
jgi:hypothetical protein